MMIDGANSTRGDNEIFESKPMFVIFGAMRQKLHKKKIVPLTKQGIELILSSDKVLIATLS